MVNESDYKEHDHYTIQAWIKRGIMVYNAYALDADDPDSAYQQVISQGGVPEDYGIVNYKHEVYKNRSRESLIEEILNLKKEIMNFWVHG